MSSMAVAPWHPPLRAAPYAPHYLVCEQAGSHQNKVRGKMLRDPTPRSQNGNRMVEEAEEEKARRQPEQGLHFFAPHPSARSSNNLNKSGIDLATHASSG